MEARKQMGSIVFDWGEGNADDFHSCFAGLICCMHVLWQKKKMVGILKKQTLRATVGGRGGESCSAVPSRSKLSRCTLLMLSLFVR